MVGRQARQRYALRCQPPDEQPRLRLKQLVVDSRAVTLGLYQSVPVKPFGALQHRDQGYARVLSGLRGGPSGEVHGPAFAKPDRPAGAVELMRIFVREGDLRAGDLVPRHHHVVSIEAAHCNAARPGIGRFPEQLVQFELVGHDKHFQRTVGPLWRAGAEESELLTNLLEDGGRESSGSRVDARSLDCKHPKVRSFRHPPRLGDQAVREGERGSDP